MLQNKSTDAMPIPHSPAWTTEQQVGISAMAGKSNSPDAKTTGTPNQQGPGQSTFCR
jgi:hypothetical protein